VLALAGHQVEVFDDKPKPGGYLRTGIPDYRLPKEILDQEIGRVERLGVVFTQNTRVGRDISFDELRGRFDAVIVAAGLHKSRGLRVPGDDHLHVYNGVELLERILRGERPEIPHTVAVVGGGNTAMDVARSVLRLGVKPIVVYRRTEAEMPAIASEVREAKQEGVKFRFLEAPTALVIEGNAIVALECQKMRLGEPDSSGRPRPVPVAGSEFRLPVSGMIAATGESSDLSFIGEHATDPSLFFAGDASTGEGTVTAAVGDGRRVAHMVDAFLRSARRDQEKPVLQTLWPRQVNPDRVAGPDSLNTAYFTSEPRPRIRSVESHIPPTSFAEIVQGFDAEAAVREARRCMACGTCNGCLNCYFWCPDIAIHGRPQNGGLRIDSQHCKGCGICVEECPRGAMSLGEVSR
jgi:NADPH-dependent glutamate synthase beta subunit-like oxidoreductase